MIRITRLLFVCTFAIAFLTACGDQGTSTTEPPAQVVQQACSFCAYY